MTADEPGLSPSQLEAWVMLSALVESVPSVIDAQLKADAGINLFEYTILAMLSEEPDRTMQMAHLANISLGSISRLSHAVTRLERRAWVERLTGTGERRCTLVRLTDDGFDALRGVAGGHIATVGRLLSGLDRPAELAAFVDAARKLIGAANPVMLGFVEQQLPGIIERNSQPGTGGEAGLDRS